MNTSNRLAQLNTTANIIARAIELLVIWPTSNTPVSALTADLRGLVSKTTSVQARADLRAWSDLLDQSSEIGEVELTLIHAREDLATDLSLTRELRDALYALRRVELGLAA